LDPQAVLVHSFKLDTELSKTQLLAFPRFIRERMAFGQLPGIRMGPIEAYASSRGHYLEFVAGPARGTYTSTVRMYLERPVVIEIWSTMGRDEDFEKQLDNVLLVAVQFFEEEARKTTLYMSFMPGSPKTAELVGKRSALKLFFGGNMLNLFLLSIAIGYPIYLLFQYYGLAQYAPIFFLVFMLGMVLSIGRIAASRSPWKATKSAREVVIVQMVVPEGDLEKYRGEYRGKVGVAKQKAYETFSTSPGLVSPERMAEIFTRSGLPTSPDNFLVKRIDVYGIVEKAAGKFNLSVPTIVITQDARPNAAATGFTKNLATMLITMGLLVQLDEEEVEVVVGHELSHLKSGDPVALFSLVAAEYLGRVYLWLKFIQAIFIPYLIFVFWGIFFFGKFLESRADLEAGIILGKPKVMAESLKKIGFRRLVLEERFLEPDVSRFGEWLRFDPHPPLYFRIQRLESLDLSNPPKHTFLSSVRAVTRGFLHAGKAP
jgi:heat shock protein HtpX